MERIVFRSILIKRWQHYREQTIPFQESGRRRGKRGRSPQLVLLWNLASQFARAAGDIGEGIAAQCFCRPTPFPAKNQCRASRVSHSPPSLLSSRREGWPCEEVALFFSLVCRGFPFFPFRKDFRLEEGEAFGASRPDRQSRAKRPD